MCWTLYHSRLMALAFVGLCIFRGACPAAVEEFVETFNGDGQFGNFEGTIVGFENPEWRLRGDGEFQNGGLKFENFAENNPDSSDGDSLTRVILGHGSFFEQVKIRNVVLEPTEDIGDSTISLRHTIERPSSLLQITLDKDGTEPAQLITTVGSIRNVHNVDSGPDVAFSILFNHLLSRVVYTFDNNLDDQFPPIRLGPYDFDGSLGRDEFESTRFLIGTNFGQSRADGLLDFWSLTEYLPLQGDFNLNDMLDADDIDQLNAEIRAETHDLRFNLNDDEVVTKFDRDIWVRDLKNTWFGDSNFDGEFNSTDLVEVFQSGEYEDGIDANSTWATGDWNGDSEFDSSDLVLAFAEGGYEIGPRFQAHAVPEPSSTVLLLPLLSVVWLRRQKSPRGSLISAVVIGGICGSRRRG